MMIDIFNNISDKWKKVLWKHKINYNNQLTVLAEECMELGHVCLKMKRRIENNGDINGYYYNFIEESIDVIIMILQFSKYFDERLIELIEEKKYKQVCERLGIKP